MANTNEKGLEHQVRFLESLEKWTTSVLEDISNDRVKEIFQDCLYCPIGERKSQPMSDKGADKMAKKIESVIIASTPKYVRAEITEALDENKFDEKFQILHDLGEKFKNRSNKAWRPPYDASEHMRTARVKIKEAQLKQLQLVISIKRQTIEGLKDKVRSSSDASIKIPELIHQIENDSASIRKKTAVLTESLVTRNHQLAQLCHFQSIGQ